jgi:hypothetical protein
MRNVKILTIIVGVFVCAACISASSNHSDDIHINTNSCLSWLPDRGYVDVCQPASFGERWGISSSQPVQAMQVSHLKCWRLNSKSIIHKYKRKSI